MSQQPYKVYQVLTLVLLIGSMAATGFAQTSQTPNSATTPEQAQQTPAGKFVQDLGNKAISVIADKSLTQQQRSDKYDDLLRSAFDLKTIGHFVAGRTWDAAPPEQQQEYMKLFEQLVIKMYGDRLSFYSGESFRVKSVRPENEKDIMVSSEVVHPGGAQPTTIEWRVRQNNDKLAIIDVIIEGVSQSVTQRQEYAAVIQSGGGKLDALIAKMRSQLQEGAQPGSSQ